MQINLLENGYRNNGKIYEDFVNNNISYDNYYFTDEIVYIDELPNFPIYTPQNKQGFVEAVKTLKNSLFMNNNREIHLNGKFWHSYLISKKREYIVENYPQVLTNKKDFANIVFKKFDWENYIYKFILAAEYIYDFNLSSKEKEYKYIEMIYDNLDLFNYLIKYNIFRNAHFIMTILTIINEENLSKILKSKIKNRPDLGNDERYGRRVIYEMNKNYPTIMYPLLSKEDLKKEIYKNLSKYQKNFSMR